MTRITLFLLVMCIANVCYPQRKTKCDRVISISLKENLVTKSNISFWILSLDSLERDISTLRFGNKKKLQSLRQLIRSLELVRDSAGCFTNEFESKEKLVIPSFFPIASGKLLDKKIVLPDLPNSKRSKLLRAIEEKNDIFQQNQINVLCEISKINQETKKNFDSLLISMIKNQQYFFKLQLQQDYQRREEECKQEEYKAKHDLKESIDNVKHIYAKAYRRFVKNKSNIKI